MSAIYFLNSFSYEMYEMTDNSLSDPRDSWLDPGNSVDGTTRR